MLVSSGRKDMISKPAQIKGGASKAYAIILESIAMQTMSHIEPCFVYLLRGGHAAIDKPTSANLTAALRTPRVFFGKVMLRTYQTPTPAPTHVKIACGTAYARCMRA